MHILGEAFNYPTAQNGVLRPLGDPGTRKLLISCTVAGGDLAEVSSSDRHCGFEKISICDTVLTASGRAVVPTRSD